MYKKKIKDAWVRTTLWEAYNRRCFFCKQVIDFRNMEVDHIIPQSLWKKPEKLKKVLKKLGLNEYFEKNSYYNLVPTHSSCNIDKNNRISDDLVLLQNY